MNKIILGLFLAFFFISTQTFAQDLSGIERSTKIELIDGKKFYIHKVKKNQTAYGLSKAYGVTVDDIYKNNPGTDRGLQLDQDLKIPYSERAIGKVELQQDSLSADGNFIYHRVERGETLYRIMKSFNVNQDMLLQYNQGLSANLHPGDIIKIPTQGKLISDKAQLLYDNIIEYKVKKKDTYYRLEKKFAVNQQQLEQLNPQLKFKGLQKGITILMPEGLKKLDTIPVFVAILPDSMMQITDSLLLDSTLSQIFDCDSILARKDTFRIALMIPFYSDLEPKIRTSSVYHTKEAKAYRSFTFIQFYEGFLMALDSMKQMGFNAEVFIYDTKGDSATVQEIIKKEEFKSLDLVIGPLFQSNVKMVLEAGNAYNIKVVSPFSREMSLVKNNPNLFKIAPSTECIIESSCDWVSDSLPNARILIIHDGKGDQKEVISFMNRSFQHHVGQGFDTNNVFIYSYQDGGLKKMIANLSSDRKNVLINLVNDEAEISNFLRELNPKAEDFEIYLIGSELNWKRFETLEVKYLVDLHLTQCSSHFIDPMDSTVHDFEQRFIFRYKTLPTSVAFNGFDISWYFFNALYYYGPGFESCLQKLNIHTMSTEFRFKKNAKGGYENSYLNIYQYDNYQLVNKRKR